jgi:hypothetical protein
LRASVSSTDASNGRWRAAAESAPVRWAGGGVRLRAARDRGRRRQRRRARRRAAGIGAVLGREAAPVRGGAGPGGGRPGSARPEAATGAADVSQASSRVARFIREDEQLKDKVLIAITGHADEMHRSQCEAVGFDYVFAKPVAWEDLKSTIDRLWPKRKMS